MKIIFVSIQMPHMEAGSGFYTDLLNGLVSEDIDITIIAPMLTDGFAGVREEGRFRVLRVPLKPFIGNYSIWQKGTRILTMSSKYKKAYKKYFRDEKFDVVMTATPPTSLEDVVGLIKRQSGARLYLLLRDIHPECLRRKHISEEVMRRTDVFDECKKPYCVNPLIDRYLYYKSQRLYRMCDWISCMSPGNQAYLREIAPYLPEKANLLLPNWYEGKTDISINPEADARVREKYGLTEKFVAIFGGTIGEAQAVWNIASLSKHNLTKEDVVFLVVGRGTKLQTLKDMAQEHGLTNMKFLEFMPRDDYEQILRTADVGLISIDEKYSVPTCPSKILGYMALGKPVLAMINEGNDYGEFYIDSSECGYWSAGMDYEKAFEQFDRLYSDREATRRMGLNGHRYFMEHFTNEIICEELRRQLANG